MGFSLHNQTAIQYNNYSLKEKYGLNEKKKLLENIEVISILLKKLIHKT